MEIIACFLVMAVEGIAVVLGMRGNFTENSTTIIISICFLIVSLVGALYYMWLQTYVLKLDLVFSAILLGFNGVSVLCGAWAVQRAITRTRVPQYIISQQNLHAKEGKKK
ncbi:hypothetical protein AGDE_09960 [Angomonas deanei]|nr:hypothetical protein AGDE_09960 [Angomonas deanei]|eukprot:EPY29429.1 hypothetical protein AGDE_09960 [Angomonas deanei]